MDINSFSSKALALILQHEGMDSPPDWPGGASGVTIGHGYDLGYHTISQFSTDWRAWLSPSDFVRLRSVVGMTAETARDRVPALHDIVIDDDSARYVFLHCSLPRTINQTAAAFPGFDKLPQDVQGVLVSLVYNRGAGMHSDPADPLDKRREMRRIRILVSNYDGETRPGGKESILLDIASQLRSMKRLWPHMQGLVDRREDEARLVEAAIATTT